MRRLLVCGLALGLAVCAARADEKAAPPPASFEALKEECDAAVSKYSDAMKKRQEELKAALEKADGAEEKAAVRKKFAADAPKSPAADFAPKFLAFAKANPASPNGPEALELALRYGAADRAKEGGVWAQAFATARDQGYLTRTEVRPLLRPLASSDDPEVKAFVRDVIAKNPDRRTQALAARALQNRAESSDRMAKALANASMREAYEKQVGKEKVEEMIAAGKGAKEQAEEMSALLRERYADVFPDLSVGRPAPEVVIDDLDGRPGRLSALKGKVVVLDVWATWCGPCRAMIPHETEMVGRLKGKPFALVSVSVDAEKKALTDFLAKTPMPWTHWWAGEKHAFVENWDITYFPTIYVLDAEGVIRFKDLRDRKLEEAVETLLEEAAKGKN